jgi:hypothetical protein
MQVLTGAIEVEREVGAVIARGAVLAVNAMAKILIDRLVATTIVVVVELALAPDLLLMTDTIDPLVAALAAAARIVMRRGVMAAGTEIHEGELLALSAAARPLNPSLLKMNATDAPSLSSSLLLA